MESEEILRQFEEIEQKVEKLISRCRSLEADNTNFMNEIERLEQELQKRAETENRYAEEKAFIRSKVDHLLNRLENMDEA